MAKVTGLAHVGVFVKDLDKSIGFYEELFGFTTLWQGNLATSDNEFSIAFLKIGDLTLELVRPKHMPPKGDGVFDHVALLVDDVEEMKDRLEAKGIGFEGGMQHSAEMLGSGAKWIFLRGPDQERIELAQIL